jgi:hypothetical protein
MSGRHCNGILVCFGWQQHNVDNEETRPKLGVPVYTVNSIKY